MNIMTNVYILLQDKTKGKRQHRMEDNTTMNAYDVQCESVDCTHLAQDWDHNLLIMVILVSFQIPESVMNTLRLISSVCFARKIFSYPWP
jgi:hypothetical protein